MAPKKSKPLTDSKRAKLEKKRSKLRKKLREVDALLKADASKDAGHATAKKKEQDSSQTRVSNRSAPGSKVKATKT